MEFIYLDLKQHVSTEKEKVTLKDIAQVYCDNAALENKLNTRVMLVNHQKKKKNLQLLDIMTVIQNVRQGQKERCMIISLGESECLVEFQVADKNRKTFWKTVGSAVSICFVGLLCFFGAGLTIMGYHNDINLPVIFSRCYEVLTGNTVQQPTLIEIFYSIGLTVGILIFFRPFQKKESSKDAPTPLEIQMHNYENDVYSVIDWNKEHEEQK